MSTQTYNGWTNWETWNVMLWLDNEYVMYQAYTTAVRRGKIRDADSAEDFIKDYMQFGTPDFISPNQYGKVNFDEIWNHMKEDIEVE